MPLVRLVQFFDLDEVRAAGDTGVGPGSNDDLVASIVPVRHVRHGDGGPQDVIDTLERLDDHAG